MGAPSDKSFLGGVQSGFLLQNQETVSGSVLYMVGIPGAQNACNSGSAVISGSVNGQSVSLSAAAGGQTFNLTGTLSADGAQMSGTYVSSAGKAADGSACGTAQAGLPWSATFVPPLTGDLQGVFHSTTQAQNQSIPVTGVLTQGDNTGAANASVTGWLTFQGYPCLGSSHQTVNVNGYISGSSVLLQVFSDSGVDIGQIGLMPTLFPQSSSSTAATFASAAAGGYTIEGTTVYTINTKSCPGDQGNICLAMGDSTACTQPVSFYSTVVPPPGSVSTDYIQPPLTEVSFPPLLVGSDPVSQTIVLTNTDPGGSTLTGLKLAWNPQAGENAFNNLSDFDGLPNFTEQDTCAIALNTPFSLAAQQSCSITLSFSPQQSCMWLPFGQTGTPFVSPSHCPPFLGSSVPTPPALEAKLMLSSPKSVDNDTNFVLPVVGLGLSALVPSTPELDFGPEAVNQSTPAQTVSFTNQGTHPVQILPAPSTPCTGFEAIPQAAQSGLVGGLQVALPPNVDTASPPTVAIFCDADLTSELPNFQFSSDTCSGKLIAPQATCSVQISYVPQPATTASLGGQGLDYFLELNTQQCSGSTQTECEIDSGRFPVELKTNPPTPLRMSPGAGLDFGYQLRGTYSSPLQIKLTNDASDPNPGPVQLNATIVSGDYQEQDDCGASLNPGSSCTFTVVFSPTTTGFDPGSITLSVAASNPIAYPTSTQKITLRGFGQ